MDFLNEVKQKHSKFFAKKRVLEVGSLDINGTVRVLFENCDYVGIDLGEGAGVDVVSTGAAYKSKKKFDVVISCEAFEHDHELPATLSSMVALLKSGGLMIFTCANEGRAEHGTARTSPQDSPFTNEFYRNVSLEYVKTLIDFDATFKESTFIEGRLKEDGTFEDLYFYGIKK